MSATFWLANLAAWSAQAAVLIVAGGAAVWAFRIRLPRIRLAYWQVLLAVCLLLPLFEPWRPAPDALIAVSTSAARVVSSSHGNVHPLPWREALLMLLLSGAAARAVWLAVGLNKLRRWRRDAREFSPLPPQLNGLRASLAPHADLRLSAALAGPVTFGLRKPVVLLPGRFSNLAPEIQLAIVCHELLHVRRRDWTLTVIEQFVRVVLWFHPAVWWLMGQVQLAREQTVDGEVVALTGDRREYLNALLAIAGNRPALDLAPAALFLRKRHLKNRVALLLKEVTMSKRNIVSFCAASGAVLFAAGWFALHTFPLQAAPVPQDADSAKLLHSVPPQYPQEALERRIEGAVVLEANIDAKGHVTDAKVLSGPEELRSAALAAILQWHYSPAAMTLPTATQVTMEFKLPKDRPPVTTTRPSPPVAAPFALKTIDVEGLSDTARDELLQRLPVHVGDTIDAERMQAIAGVVSAFDNHLALSARSGEGELRISIAPPAPALPPSRIRVGGGVQQAKLLVKVPPVYPPEAKAERIQGLVTLQATIDKKGNVANLQVLSGDDTLAAAALDAVRQWQYQTTLLNGEPVEVITQIDVNFTLSQ